MGDFAGQSVGLTTYGVLYRPLVSLLGCLRSGLGRPVEERMSVQKLKASLWLAEEYPLTLQDQLLPIVDLLVSWSVLGVQVMTEMKGSFEGYLEHDYSVHTMNVIYFFKHMCTSSTCVLYVPSGHQ